MKRRFSVASEVWLYPGMAGWHFLTIPKKESETIKKEFGSKARGWGSLPVRVTLGTSAWKTSIFPDKKSGTYLLPLKAQVRRKEDVAAGEKVSFSITLIE